MNLQKTQSALYYFTNTCSLHCFSRRSRVEALEEISVPCSRFICLPLDVVEFVCSVVQHLGDDDGSFPGRGQLVRSLLIHSETLNLQKTQSALYYFTNTCSLHCFSRRSRVEALEEISVPCSRFICLPLDVVEFVCSVVQHLGDDDGSFPGRGQLVRSLLIHSEHQVACLECTTPDVSRMKAPQILLING